MLPPIPEPLLAIAEIGSNHLLSLDDNVLQRCAALQGKCVGIEITDLEQQIYCHPGSWGIRLSQQPPNKAVDASISGRLFALIDLVLDEDKVSTSIREGVSIQGDAEVARQLQKMLSELDIDWEEVMSRYTGDVLAFQINQKTNRVGEFIRHSLASLMQTNSDYLREEIHMTPTQIEFERFSQLLTETRQEVDRAEVRVRQLLQLWSEQNKP